MTTANRFHLVPPRTWDSIFPPSLTYISWPRLLLGADRSGRDGRSAKSSGRRAPVLVRRQVELASPAITPERQPLVAPEHFTHNLRTGSAKTGEDPPVQGRRRCRRPCPVGTQENPLTRLAVG